jgi:hypothetical protein
LGGVVASEFFGGGGGVGVVDYCGIGSATVKVAIVDDDFVGLES